MKKKKVIASIIVSLLLVGCSNKSVIMVTNLSSDGNYAVTSDMDKNLILWDIQKKQSKVISDDANIYSAYFIKGTHEFMYQNDKTNEVIIQNVDGNIIKQFNPGFPTYGEAITTDLNSYFAVDENDQLFEITNGNKAQLTFYHCNDSDPAVPAGMQGVCGSVQSDMKISNLIFTNDQTVLYNTLAGTVYTWSVKTGALVNKISSDAGLDNIALSTDNHYLVGSDSNSNRGMICDLQTNTCKKISFYMPTSTPPLSDTLAQGDSLVGGGVSNTIKFIAPDTLINFIQTAPDPFNYGILYNPTNIQTYDSGWAKLALSPLKFLPLNQETSITDNSTTGRNLSFDSIPNLGIAACGAFNSEQLLVYRYDPSSQILKQIWIGNAKPWWKFW